MKKRLIKICIIFVLLMIGPITLVAVGFGVPAQYGKTYYGELPEMCTRLRETSGKRIIVVGGSAVAFGLCGDLIEAELPDYTVCPFGLYGSIGTKVMMDLSRNYLREGDIVLLAPEQGDQSMSMYFNGEYVWRAVDGNYGLLGDIAWENVGSMTGAFPAFAAQKLDYFINESAPAPDTVYAKSSFDNQCKMIYDRPNNIMPGGADTNSLVSYAPSVLSDDFAEYVNKYVADVKNRGAKIYFAFTPVNAAGIANGTNTEDIDGFYDVLDDKLDCEILGNPHDYILEREWFYDSNVHCNSAGAVAYTRRLTRDIKSFVLGDLSAVNITVPNMPAMPDIAEDYENADNTFANRFEYEEVDGKLTAKKWTGVDTAVILPAMANGKRVTALGKDAFVGNTVIEEIRLQSNIRRIENGSFDGCSGLKRLYVAVGSDPDDCAVGNGLLIGAPDCKIYVERSRLSAYANDYFWSQYAGRMVAY